MDTFHMNIEEDSIEQAIMKSRGLLRHMHFADDNRKMPGYAHINFQEVVKGLKNVDYNQYISFEPKLTDKGYAVATKKGLEFIRSMWKNEVR